MVDSRSPLDYLLCLRTYVLPRRALESLQMKRLRSTLGRASDDVPHYRDLIRSAGMAPSDFRSLDDLRKLPVLTKGEVMRNGRRMLSSRSPATYLISGSGTTGQSLVSAKDGKYRSVNSALVLRGLAVSGIMPWDRFVTVWPPKRYWRKAAAGKQKGEPTTPAFELGVLGALWRFSTMFRHVQAAEDGPRGDLDRLLELKPKVIIARASHLLRMAEFFGKPRGDSTVKVVNCTSESFTDVAARKLEETFGGKVIHSLGSADAGTVGSECRFQRGMHLNEDWAVYEVLKDGEPVGPGEKGELVATVLCNDAMPLVRYATGDTVELAEGGTCDCGSSMVRVRKMHGRKEDWLRTAEGSMLSSFEVAEYLEGALGMKDYQVVQRGVGRFVVQTTDPSTTEKTLAVPLREYLAGLVGVDVELTFAEMSREDLWLKSRPVIGAQ